MFTCLPWDVLDQTKTKCTPSLGLEIEFSSNLVEISHHQGRNQTLVPTVIHTRTSCHIRTKPAKGQF